MSAAAIFQLLVLLVLLGVTVPPLGRYLAGVFGDPELGGEPEPTLGERLFGPIERVIYRACRVNPGAQQRWTCLLYTSPSPRDRTRSRMPSSA